MPLSDSRTFLRELDKKLWTAADKLRSNLDAVVYKHTVLGLIFLKYVSDSFSQRQPEIEAMLKDPESDLFVDPDIYDKPLQYDKAIHRELEERDYYIEKSIFLVPALARCKTLQDSAKLPAGTVITVENGKTTTSEITSTGKLIDDFKGNPPRFIFHVLGEIDFTKYTDKPVVPGINRNHLYEEPTIVSPLHVRESFSRIFGPFLSKSSVNERQSRTLVNW